MRRARVRIRARARVGLGRAWAGVRMARVGVGLRADLADLGLELGLEVIPRDPWGKLWEESPSY